MAAHVPSLTAEQIRAMSHAELEAFALGVQVGRSRRATEQREALSFRRAAEVLGISRSSTLPALVAAGRIRVVDVAGQKRIPRSECERVLREGAKLEAPVAEKPKRRRRGGPTEDRPGDSIRAIKWEP